MAGDVETNPGPTICDYCNGVVKSNTTPLVCNQQNCTRVSHSQQKCSQISRWLKGPKIWYCRNHTSTPPQISNNDPVVPNNNLPTANEDRTCNSCSKKINRNGQPLICEEPDCENVCHIQERCSRVKRHTKEKKWRCTQHKPQPNDGVDEEVHEQTDQPSEAVEENEKRYCKHCAGYIRKGTNLKCMQCLQFYHKQSKCSGLTRDTVKVLMEANSEWMCPECEKKESRDFSSTPQQTASVSEKVHGRHRTSLKFLQWNADGLATKVPELQERLKKEDIDVVLIQETKLQPHLRTPKIQGYKIALRSDRRGGIKGGGLATYVRDSIIYVKGPTSAKKGTEVSTIKIRLSKSNWMLTTNVYTPPPNSIGQEIEFHPEIIPTQEHSIVMGDFNAHSPLWDRNQPPDARGEDIETWSMVEELSILNDGRDTRINKITGGQSSPNITMVGKRYANKC